MMPTVDLILTSRTFLQTVEDRKNSYNVNGTAQDDRIEIYNGNIFGAGGNDYLARIDTNSGNVSVNYWNAEKGVRINLAEGWADDGLGGRDTLVGIASATGSQSDDYFWGDAKDNYYYGQAGHDVIDGGAGNDGIGIAGFMDSTGKFRNPLLSELIIQVSADGRSAVVIDPSGTGNYFKYDLHDIEYLSGLNSNNEDVQLDLSSLINPSTVALNTVAAGPAFRWNLAQALGTSISLTYSFMSDFDTATGKRPMSISEKAAVRITLAYVSSFTGLVFAEVQESTPNVGQLRWGVSQQSNSKGYTWMPEASNLNAQAGDIYMDEDSMLYLQSGGQGFAAMLHELGHALGLRHLTNSDATDHWTQVAADRFNTPQWTVMAPSNTVDSLSRADFGILDIAALRYLYGVKAVNLSASIYKLADIDGQCIKTIIDDGGFDTIDCSALSTGVSINLETGKFWDIGLTKDGVQATNNMSAALGTVLEDIIGSAHDDVFIGNTQNNQFTPGKGNDWIDGAQGLDKVYLDGKKADFSLRETDTAIEVWSTSANTGLKTLSHIERIVFQDTAIAWDLGVNQAAGQTALLIGAVLPGKLALDPSKQALLGSVIGLFDLGYSMPVLSGALLRLDIWSILTGQSIPTASRTLAQDTAIVKYLLSNLYGTVADDATVRANAEVMHNEASQGTWLAQLALSTAGQSHIGLVGLAATGLAYV